MVIVGAGMIEVFVVVTVSRMHPTGFLVTVVGTSLVRIEISVVVIVFVESLVVVGA